MGSRYQFAEEELDLPTPWKALVDSSTGYLYFWNPSTNVTQYEMPKADPNPNPNPKEEEGGIQNEQSRTHQVLAEACPTEATMVEKCLEVKKDLHSIGQVSKASRNNSETDRKLEDAEACQCNVQRENLSLNTKGSTCKKDIEQTKHPQDFEKKLQNDQERRVHRQRLLNEMKRYFEEEEELENARQMNQDLDAKMKNLDKKEEELLVWAGRLNANERDLDAKLKNLDKKEEELLVWVGRLDANERDLDVKMKNLEKKEEELLVREERLIAHERIQTLIDDYNASLAAKRQEFWLETDKKRKFFNEETKCKFDAMNIGEKKIGCNEEQISKREQTQESKFEKLENMGKVLGAKSEALKKREASADSDTEKLEEEKHIDEESPEAPHHTDPSAVYSRKKRHHSESTSMQVNKLDDMRKRSEQWLHDKWERSKNEGLQARADTEELQGVSLHADPSIVCSRQKSNQTESASTELLSSGDFFPRQQTSASRFETPRREPYTLRSCTTRSRPQGT